MQKTRVAWLDIARGIGIIFVVLGHVLPTDHFPYLIYAFHIPLFFFLSGIVFQYKPRQSLLFFVQKNVKSILIPYILIALLQLVLWDFQNHFSNLFSSDAIQQFWGIFYGSGRNNFLAFNSVLWFLPCLFVAKTGFGILSHFSHEKKHIAIFLCFFSLVGYFLSVAFPHLALPLQIEVASSAIVFFGAGFLFGHEPKIDTLLKNNAWLMFLSLLIISAITATGNYLLFGHKVDMRLNLLNNFFLFYISAFSGIFAWIVLSIIIKKNRVLEHIGKHSLFIFVWHPFILYYLSLFVAQILSVSLLQARKNFLYVFYTLFAIAIALGLQKGTHICKGYIQTKTRKIFSVFY